jgi:excisionase family DNA binding protein
MGEAAMSEPRASTIGEVSTVVNVARPCFTIPEAAQHLRISRAFLYKLISARRIKTVKLGTRTIIRGAELERFLDQLEAGA